VGGGGSVGKEQPPSRMSAHLLIFEGGDGSGGGTELPLSKTSKRARLRGGGRGGAESNRPRFRGWKGAYVTCRYS
jgi:hypothetical protein